MRVLVSSSCPCWLNIASGEVPNEMAKMRVLELDLMNVVAGTRFRRTLKNMNNIIKDIEDGNVILFIDRTSYNYGFR